MNALLDFPSQFNKNKPLPDFYVIGLQEVKSQPQNILMDSLFTDAWTSTFNNILCRQGYIIAKLTRLQGILLLVYTQMKHGNKGAVSIRFNIYGCSVCLVNCHLTAHEHLLVDRISDYNTIIKQHHYVFWIGDLNFRTDHPTGSSPTSEEIVATLQKVEKDKYNALLKHDQLKANIKLRADLISYNHISHYTVSDHKPVVAQFNIKFAAISRIWYIGDSDFRTQCTLSPDVTVNSNDWIGIYDVSVVFDTQKTVEFAAISRIWYIGDSDFRTQCTLSPDVSVNSNDWIGIYDVKKTVEFAAISRIWYIGDSDFRTQCTLSPDVSVNSNDWIGIYDVSVVVFDTQKTVEFAAISGVWYIGDSDFRTQCTLSPDVSVNSNDWIGIHDYLAKVSLPEAPAASGQPRAITLSFPVGSGVRTPGFYRLIYFSQPNNDVRSVLAPAASGQPRAITLSFPVGSGVRTPGFYRLIYFSQPNNDVRSVLVSLSEAPAASGQPRAITLSFPVGSGVRTPGFYRLIYFSQPNNDVRSVLGKLLDDNIAYEYQSISEPFEVSSREEKLLTTDPSDQASTSTSPSRPKPSSATTDIFTDFTGLDVSKLSRHFSNDLSID
ncbi:putative skeletal muscle/kidney enriched inositol 5-phosphatase [Operophtera brumata]|uniref:Putative skeletal muscle/kidney enriched inositol 5-phosphatase n=1 Tax=Operophtera brumata TaxID=104452 RepID=A0A0L7L0J8_OPEBR|nr:putative skeletal muscle/kidney enriched inositol 5-phosphatase [Operophtera brumata]